jgi:hypothetical protein
MGPCLLAPLRFAGNPVHTVSIASGTSRIAPSSSAGLAALDVAQCRIRLLARLVPPVSDPRGGLSLLRIFSMAVFETRDARLFVAIPVSLLIATLVADFAALPIAVAMIAIPVITPASALRVAVAVIASVVVTATEASGVEMHTAVGSVGVSPTRRIVVVMPTADVTVTAFVVGMWVVPGVDVHGSAIAPWQQIRASVVARRRRRRFIAVGRRRVAAERKGGGS